MGERKVANKSFPRLSEKAKKIIEKETKIYKG